MTLMIQKEMAMRILAKNTKLFGSMTLFCQYHFNIQQGFQYPDLVFFLFQMWILMYLNLHQGLTFFQIMMRLFFCNDAVFFWGRRNDAQLFDE